MRVNLLGKRVGVDLDEVLFEFVLGFTKFHNHRWGTNLQKSDFHTYKFEEIIGCSRKEIIGRVHMFFETSEFRYLPVVEGSPGGILRLQLAGNELYAITSRQKKLSDITSKQLDEHFPGFFSDIYLSKSSYSNRGGLTKAELCKKLGLSYMVEDWTEHALGCAGGAPDTRVLLFNKPWNQRVDCRKYGKRISRLRRGWGDINMLRPS